MIVALVPLLDGFEEIEAVAVIDLLRRAEIEVIVAGVEKLLVTGSHKIAIPCDRLLADVAGREFDIVILPGGPVTPQLGASSVVRALVCRHAEREKWVCAICAAPSILADLELLDGRRAACHPTVDAKMKGARIEQKPVVVDGRFITSRGAGTAVLFALEIIRCAAGEEKARRIATQICLPCGLDD
jgi:4-methyl-5(b-hydroxyethyl)-thiazole monophosphate biosynthesis